MKFSELLNQYIHLLGCTGQELAEHSGISASVISRYRSGEREPHPDSEAVKTLARTFAAISEEKSEETLSEEEILSAFQEALLSKSRIYDTFLHRFDVLYQALNLNMKDIAAFTNFDTSFLYRIKSGERRTSDLPALCDKLTKYLAVSAFSDAERKKIAALIGTDISAISDSDDFYNSVYHWLLPSHESITSAAAASASPEAGADMSQFLSKLDEFDLEDYIRVIHFDDIKVPTLPVHLPATRNYYGISKMREGELDFFKLTVTSRSSEPIFMCSDMPMSDMAESNDFNKKWMFAIACAIKKGLHLNIIHSLNRPFEELMLGLEAWIPIYMTGQVSPYYIPNHVPHVYHHLNYVSGVAALCGECIEDSHIDGKYTLTNNKEELAYYHKKAKHILSHAKPLMEIFDRPRLEDYQAFLQKDAEMPGERENLLSSLPIYTISEGLLDKILSANHIGSSDAQYIRSYWASEVRRMQQKLASCIITDEIALPDRESYEDHPMYLSVSGCFFETPILYSYEDMTAHLKETQRYAETHGNYHLKLNEISAFRNIQIEILKDRYVIVSKIKSPSIHFVIKHPMLVNALQNFTVPVVE